MERTVTHPVLREKSNVFHVILGDHALGKVWQHLMEFAVLGGTVAAGLPHPCLLILVTLVTYAQLVMSVQMGQTSSLNVNLEPTGMYAAFSLWIWSEFFILFFVLNSMPKDRLPTMHYLTKNILTMHTYNKLLTIQYLQKLTYNSLIITKGSCKLRVDAGVEDWRHWKNLLEIRFAKETTCLLFSKSDFPQFIITFICCVKQMK